MSLSSVLWVALWSGVTIAGVAGIVASANSSRMQRRVEREARGLLDAAETPPVESRTTLGRLPGPVRRYLTKAIAPGRATAHIARLEQNGMFRPSLQGKWFPITGRQYFTAAPPGFIWWGRVQIAPGIWIDALDRSVNGVGNMLIRAESTVTIADAVGPELDQGALLRLLGELAWLPTAYLDERYIRWAAVDDRHATATLAVNGRQVTGLFEFGVDDFPLRFTANRFRDVGGGKSVLTPFVGECHDYRDIGGLIVPHQVIGSWVIDGTPMPYARFNITRIEFDVEPPSSGAITARNYALSAR
jgi:hypothetical protein